MNVKKFLRIVKSINTFARTKNSVHCENG